MSLQSTYQSRKELLVENLETMGVTDYSADDGLTTLINAVLEIAPVPPTPTPASITLSCDKPIMMTGETATITATVLDSNGDPCEGETVSFEVVNGESLGSDVTDENGEASVYYLGEGVGDLNIKADCRLLTKTYSISDCMYWNSGASVGSLIYDTGTTCTSNGEYISFGTSTSGEKYCKIPVTVENGSNWELEYTVAKLGTAQTSAFAVMYGTNDYVLCRPRDGKISVDGTKIGNNGYSRDFQANDVINWKYLNGTLTVTLNGTVTLYNGVTAISDITALRWYTNQNRMQHFKNIKVKPL